MSMGLVCVKVCAHELVVSLEALDPLLLLVISCPTWVLGIKLGYSGRVI